MGTSSAWSCQTSKLIITRFSEVGMKTLGHIFAVLLFAAICYAMSVIVVSLAKLGVQLIVVLFASIPFVSLGFVAAFLSRK